MTTTHTTGINWAVIEDGKIVSLHRDHAPAKKKAAVVGGYILATTRKAPALTIGDQAKNYAGIAIHV